ncbi:MAG: MBL fold metallo-hydrolase [Methylobacteriaceae bacterium]|nr:MBL fold metallo-hydrolase [Methylobacteriaceae bacterium]MBV9395269.1 MBL fold metallo-hydrolase [Methylobacteriaceae bacterium]
MADDDIPFEHNFDPKADEVQQVSPLIRRVLAPNPGPFTFTGTCTYIVGRGELAIVDPGPDNAEHVQALIEATKGERVANILVTHTHRDHAPASRALQAATGAAIVGCRPYEPRHANAQAAGLDAAHDTDYRPARVLSEGDTVEGPGFTLEAIATPGHASNHLAFALREENALFSGDHVMAWSTSIVAPPDGSMNDYMASLEKLRDRSETIYWPGHGGPVREPQRYLRALIHHRHQRETAILTRIKAGDTLIPEMVERIYEGLDARLKGAAALSVLAHLEDLVARGVVRADGPPRLATHYTPA